MLEQGAPSTAGEALIQLAQQRMPQRQPLGRHIDGQAELRNLKIGRAGRRSGTATDRRPAQKARVLAGPDGAVGVEDVARQSHRRRATRPAGGVRLLHDRAHVRPVVRRTGVGVLGIHRRVRPAGEHVVAARRMGVVAGRNGPQHAQLVGPLGQLGHQLAELHAGHASWRSGRSRPGRRPALPAWGPRSIAAAGRPSGTARCTTSPCPPMPAVPSAPLPMLGPPRVAAGPAPSARACQPAAPRAARGHRTAEPLGRESTASTGLLGGGWKAGSSINNRLSGVRMQARSRIQTRQARTPNPKTFSQGERERITSSGRHRRRSPGRSSCRRRRPGRR